MAKRDRGWTGGLWPSKSAETVAHAAGLMRSRTREAWLVPLLAVPLVRIAQSPIPDAFDLEAFTGDCGAALRERTDRAAAAIQTATTAEPRALSDDDAYELVAYTYDLRSLIGLLLCHTDILLTGVGAPIGVKGDPRIRYVGAWIAAGRVSLPLSALIAAHLLHMAEDDRLLLPRPHTRFGPMTRALDRRAQDEGCATWEDALVLAARYWAADGWLDLGLWEQSAKYRMGRSTEVEEWVNHDKNARDTEVRQHRAERKRLQASLAQAKDELRVLRSAGNKVERLRTEVEGLRRRAAELVQSRDRALARAGSLEAENCGLEQSVREARIRLAAVHPELSDTPEATPPVRTLPEVVYSDEVDLPATLLAGRDVFFFTGEERRSTAEATAEPLRRLGAREIRTFCLRKGGLGPETFPAGALVVLDIRFVGHSQSLGIAQRAERSGAMCLSVKSGKGSLARTVASALLAERH